jgi:hypothetical protein
MVLHSISWAANATTTTTTTTIQAYYENHGERVHMDASYGDPHRLDADGDGTGCDRYG